MSNKPTSSNYNTPEYINDESFVPNPQDFITVRGARQHNLKDVSVFIPKNKLTVFSGLSGSGKSSLVFDTIYAEGQRRYVESLSSYARQFLGLKEKPDVDVIEGLSPAISIDQKSTTKNPRSTVGTITEIHDYMRLLFAKIGKQIDPETGQPVQTDTVTSMAKKLFGIAKGKTVVFLAPMVNDKKGLHKSVLLQAEKDSYRRVRVDGNIMLIEEAKKLELKKTQKHSIEIVIDRVTVSDEDKQRVVDAFETTLKIANDKADVLVSDEDGDKVHSFSRSKLQELEPRMFSFNSPQGACTKCNGIGYLTEVDPDLIVPNETLSIKEGAIRPFSRMLINGGWFAQIFEKLAKKNRFKLDAPWSRLTDKAKETIMYGNSDFEGVITNLKRRYKETQSDAARKDIESYMSKKTCTVCEGARLNQRALSVMVAGHNISDVASMSITDCLDHFEALQDGEKTSFDTKEFAIAKMILKEVVSRLKFLNNVGLGYLNLARYANTLSGGEAQRIRLATQIGSGLTGVLYILDEPSIGLHQRDNSRLLETLQGLKEMGNTVLVVEHDEDTMRAADFLVDIGPAAGKHGGHVVATGTPAEVEQVEDSPTGRFLAGVESIEVPSERRGVATDVSKKKVIKNIIFDIDGVMIEHRVGDIEFLMNRFGIPEEDAKAAYDKTSMETMTADTIEEALEFYDTIIKELGVKKLKAKKFAKEWCEYNSDVIDENIKYLKQLRKQGYRLIAATNQNAYRTEYILGELGFEDVFDSFYSSCVLGEVKPSANFYQKIIDRALIKPQESLFIDDTKANIKAAKKLGFKTLLYDHEDMYMDEELNHILEQYEPPKVSKSTGNKKNTAQKWLTIKNATENNLKGVTADIPLSRFVCVTGVSGSGKSTLINQILSSELMNYFYDSKMDVGKHDDIEGLNNIDKPIIIDQSAIGRTPRSNPATYTGLFTPIRELFAATKEAKARGYNVGRFSFNVEGGRCETCKGEGLIKVEMNFLPDVYIECEDCQSHRYNRETLEITYNGKTISDVLEMTVEDALEFFDNHKVIKRKLETLSEVGLTYVHLGQSATTLSGGEAQRVKLATELSKVGTGNTMYILDEPTTGLHPIDVKKLLGVLQKLVDKGNTVLVIEHNLDVIKCADWLVDLGPEGGDAGGLIVASGTPEQVAEVEDSYTGQYLKNIL